MKKIIFFFVVFFLLGIVLGIKHFELMELGCKRNEYKKAINEAKKRNVELEERRDTLLLTDYETVRREAIKLGLIKKEEKVIRFYEEAR